MSVWRILRKREKKISSDDYLIKQDMYMSESLHVDYYLEHDVNSIFVEHHQNRKKQMLGPFSFQSQVCVCVKWRGQTTRWV